MSSSGACVITGGAGDLGRAMAAVFLRDGFAVYAADVREADGPKGVQPVTLDVTDREAVLALAQRAHDEAGPLRVWINGAGIFVTGAVKAADSATWDKLIGVNLTGTFHGCDAAVRVMTESSTPGRIINISSISGQIGGLGVHPAYGASKAGVIALTKTYALEGAKAGITCNAVAPALLEGTMLSQFDVDRKAKLAAQHPLRRFGTVDEVASAVRYLASAEAAYTNGVVLPVNGGAHMG